MQAVDDATCQKLQSRYLQYLPALFRRELVVNVAARKAWVAGDEVSMSEQEFDLLAFLYERQGTEWSADEIAKLAVVRPQNGTPPDEFEITQLVEQVKCKLETEPLTPHYLKTIPGAGYRLDTDEFMGRFLLIFESILDPIERTVDNSHFYFDPLIAPESFVPWLTSWLGLCLDRRIPPDQRRRLLREGAELYRWRGTKKGLTEYLKIFTGVEPSIVEEAPGMVLGPQTRLGENTVLGGGAGEANHFSVTLDMEGADQVDVERLRAIIESQKPAHTNYTLHIRQRERQGEVKNGA
jgi:phage tail-like protein